MMTAATFGHRKFLERLYTKLKDECVSPNPTHPQHCKQAMKQTRTYHCIWLCFVCVVLFCFVCLTFSSKTVGKLMVPIFHQLLHAACQQGQPETAEFLLHVRLEFQTDRRIAHSPAFKVSSLLSPLSLSLSTIVGFRTLTPVIGRA